ncbi:MAG: hypothetical protein QQN45_07695, partial [Nitrosopumilus sp.]
MQVYSILQLFEQDHRPHTIQMCDLQVQTLRKERGYNPTDVLDVASILDLDEESLEMVKERTKDLAFLVRVKQVNFTESCKEYKDDDIDGQKIRISVE